MAAALALVAAFAASAAPLQECHVEGVRNGVLCGSVPRPLDPGHTDRGQISVRYVVVPAMARRKLPDPVFLLAGGPGQSAIALAASTLPLFARLNNRRDIVFVDQRGTGTSAPLICQEPEHESLAAQADPERQFELERQCKAALLRLPYLHGEADLGFFTTWIAVQDLDAVRRDLGADRIDLVGGSYGTRVALEYERQFPKAVRRMVLDGVAPPDMVLPASFSLDGQAALDGLVAACAADPACAVAHPDLGARFSALLHGLPRPARARNPLTGREEAFTATGEFVLGAVRNALYTPALAAALPQAIDDATHDDFAGLLGLNATAIARKSTRLAMGMHLSVICAEDVPRLDLATDRPGADFADEAVRSYRRLCSIWPRGAVPAEFYSVAASASPVLILSGGADPATPPRHGARVAQALGPMARHVVVANAGHGVMGLGCMRDVIFRFVDAETDAAAFGVDASCAAQVPRPPSFRPIRAADSVASAGR